jgi:deoxyribonucleoside regulator
MASVTRRRDAGQVRGENIVIEAAWLYYHDGLNQSEIAARLQVSRATVVNCLQEARERGYIRNSL